MVHILVGYVRADVSKEHRASTFQIFYTVS